MKTVQETMPLAYTDPRKVLSRHGLAPKRHLSQNFLCSPLAVERIALATGARDGDTVVELGPGCGTLTTALLASGARVIAIERDPDMRRVLAAELGAYPLTIRDGDATTTDYHALREELFEPPRVAGNLPYAITGAIVRRLIDDAAHIHSAVVMVQREVADRLCTGPGSRTYGGLTVFTENVFKIDRVARVPASAFFPRPQVDSAVVRLRPRSQPIASHARFADVVRAAFQARRKTLRNALQRLEGVDAAAATRALTAANIAPNLRAEQLDVAALDRLAHQLFGT